MIHVVIVVNYAHEHDFIYGCIYMCIREETSSHGLKTLTESSDPKIYMFMDAYIHICLWIRIREHGCI